MVTERATGEARSATSRYEGEDVRLEIQLHGECAARFDSEADLLGWVAGEPAETTAMWHRMSVNAWARGREVPARWLEGLLPEGLSKEPFEMRAARAGPDTRAGRGVITLLWGNSDHEYAGAVEIARDDEPKGPPGWRPVDEAELGALVAENARERAERGRPRWPPADAWRKSALAGMRGKIGVRRTNSGWAVATGSGLSTWIVKHEDRRKLPGEAGTEAIMQRTLAHIGVRTARTESRMFAGMQCVLSERSDRNDWGGGVEAVHQEDFLQASGWPAQRKYEEWVKGEPGYVELYRALGEHSAEPEREQAMLTRLIAACVMGANADMHRKNIGLLHETGAQIPRVTLAPVYDFGSWAGLERTFAGRGEAQGKLALGVNGIDEPSRIGAKQWAAMAEQAGLDTEGTIEEVRAVGRALPEAIAQAQAEANTTDENHDQGWVDRRVEATVRYAERRARALEHEIESRARKGRSSGTRRTKPSKSRTPETGDSTEEVARAPGTGQRQEGAGEEQTRRAAQAQRIHSGRTRHPDPVVRADAHVALAAMAPPGHAAQRLAKVLAEDAELASSPEAAEAIRAGTDALAAPESRDQLREGAVEAATSSKVRAEFGEALRAGRPGEDKRGATGKTRKSANRRRPRLHTD